MENRKLARAAANLIFYPLGNGRGIALKRYDFRE
jgi:hypothetical protein